ncbi:MAG: hypothetical protein R2779_10080 [Crocinitomicaceae bacterium]
MKKWVKTRHSSSSFRDKNGYEIDKISTSYSDVPHGEKMAIFNEPGVIGNCNS